MSRSAPAISGLSRFRRAAAMAFWKVSNPVALRFAGGPASWWVVLETTGRITGTPCRVPLARGPADDHTAWLIAVHGPHASFVKNLQADPRVRIKIRGHWRRGRAHLQPLDTERLSEFNLYSRGGPKTLGIDPRLLRIDLDPAAPASSSSAGSPHRGPSALGRLTAAGSEFANERGLYLGRRSTKLHVALYRLSGGRLGNHIPGWPAARIALVDHTGAKSGVTRTSPLMYLEDGDAVVVMASKAGQPTHPAWFHNLRANPETTVQIGRARDEVRARVADPEERERLWDEFLAIYPPSEAYQRNAGARQIPILVFERR